MCPAVNSLSEFKITVDFRSKTVSLTAEDFKEVEIDEVIGGTGGVTIVGNKYIQFTSKQTRPLDIAQHFYDWPGGSSLPAISLTL